MRSILAPAAFTLALTAALPAQLQCVETHANEPINTNTTTGGPNLLLAMKLTATASFELSGAQVLTGLLNGPGTMDIWSHDMVNDRPLASVTGAGSYAQTEIVTWQGATFPGTLMVSTGQVFWLVWGMPNGSRTPWSTSASGTIPYRGSFDGGQTWSGANNGANPWPAKPYKVRLFCKYQTAPVQSIGIGKAGDGGYVPQSRMLGWPALGNEIGLLLEKAATGRAAVLALGTPGNTPIPGVGTLYVTPLITLVTMTTGTSSRPVPGGGAALFSLQLQQGWFGFPLTAQWWILDPQAAVGLSHSQGTQAILQ